MCASGTYTSSVLRPRSTSSPSGSVSSYSPSEIVSGPITAVGVTDDAGERLLRVDPRLEVEPEDLAVDATVERRLARRDRIRVVLARPFPELHGWDDNLRAWQRTPSRSSRPVAGEREEYAGVLRFYELAKRQEWQVRDLPWNELPPIPEGKGSPQRRARRQDMWRSVLTQQLQADMLACEMASQLLNVAPDPEAKLYYSTMVQDESRHTEAWLKLINDVGGIAERDPYLDELAHMTLEADTLEEKVFQMQVFYERLIISRFRLIARASRGTVLEDLCNRLATDDGIHHGAGMAYERVLLAGRGQEDEPAPRRRGEPAAPDLRQARALAAEGAGRDRAADVRARPPAPRGRPPGGRQAGRVARPRRQRRGAAQALGGFGLVRLERDEDVDLVVSRL